MQAYVGLESQRGWRDLRLLPEESGRWVSEAELAHAPEPAVVCGLWVSEDGAAAVLRQRQQAGRVTVLVPRFQPMDLQRVLGAPARVQIEPAESSEVRFQGQDAFAVPATTAIDTPLPEGHWGRAGDRVTVLAWRPHTQSGITVVCTPTVAGRALGATASDQLRLLERILDEARALVPANPTAEAQVPAAATAQDFLDQEGDLGALALLAWWAAPGPTLDAGALQRVGARLDADELVRLGAALPPLEPSEVYETLKAAGWGAHLRVLEHRPAEEP